MSVAPCTNSRDSKIQMAAAKLYDKYAYAYNAMQVITPAACKSDVDALVQQGQRYVDSPVGNISNLLQTSTICPNDGCKALKNAFQWGCDQTPAADYVLLDTGVAESQIEVTCPRDVNVVRGASATHVPR